MVSRERPGLPGGLLLVALVSLSVSPGCTSALTTAYLKGTPWNLSDPADADESGADDPTGSAAVSAPTADPQSSSPEARAEARQAAIERAIDSLATAGTVDAETEAALITLLQGTDQEDWPTVVDEFVAALAAMPHVAAKPAPLVDVVPVTAAVPPPEETARDPFPAASVAPTAPEPPDLTATHAPPTNPGTPDAAAPLESGPNAVETTALGAAAADLARPEGSADDGSVPEGSADDVSLPDVSVNNACFATRVQAWGAVDRFTADRFRPGQEVIVYFELENLSVDRTPAGHTTCIDTDLVLVAADGRRIHDWSFEPIQETCPARRRDYFARYVVRIPGSAPAGSCRLEIAVTDTLAGRTATTTLPLEIVTD